MSLVWSEVLSQLEKKVSRPLFSTWLKPTHLISEQSGLITIGVANHYAKDWIEKNYVDDIRELLKKHFEDLEDVRFVIQEKETKKPLSELPLLKEDVEAGLDVDVDKEIEVDKKPKNTQFNPSYTFETFIVGNNNRLAFAASQAVAEKPGQAYNPLFIYGGVGLGKTHLMQAIGNKILEHSPNKKIIYTSCEIFTSDFITSLQSNSINDFKNKYRNADVLLIDDIQFLANKEGTQEEFFHTFNILHQKNRQIVLTSDRVPKEMTELEDRLISRLGWGLIADIQSPNFETRLAILQEKAKEKNISIPNDVMEHIASTITSNVRELEGSLIKLTTAALLEDTEVTKEFAIKALKDILKSSSPNVSGKKVLRVVAEYFSIEQSEILGKKRTKDLVYPRQLIMYLLREQLNWSYPQIGELLGGKDHTTIMYGVNKVSESKKKSSSVDKDIRNIKERLF